MRASRAHYFIELMRAEHSPVSGVQQTRRHARAIEADQWRRVLSARGHDKRTAIGKGTAAVAVFGRVAAHLGSTPRAVGVGTRHRPDEQLCVRMARLTHDE